MLMVTVMRLRLWVQARPVLATPLALLSLPFIVVIGLSVLSLNLLIMILGAILQPLLIMCFPIIVEYLYMWPCVGRVHVWLLGTGRKGKSERIFHSRFLDLRVEVLTAAPPPEIQVPLAGPARRFVHLIPQFRDNYCYLIVDAVEVVLPRTTAAESSPEVTRFYFGVLVDPADELALETALAQIDEMYYDGKLDLQMVQILERARAQRFSRDDSHETDICRRADFSEMCQVLTTHKHWDHQSGNAWLSRTYGTRLTFYSGEQDVLRRVGASKAGPLLVDGDSLQLRYTLLQKV
jgi:hypothetical protein